MNIYNSFENFFCMTFYILLLGSFLSNYCHYFLNHLFSQNSFRLTFCINVECIMYKCRMYYIEDVGLRTKYLNELYLPNVNNIKNIKKMIKVNKIIMLTFLL